MAPLALVTQSQAKHLSSPPQSALTITGRELPSFLPAEIYSSLRVTFLYILAPGDLNWDDERQPRRHELDPMEQGGRAEVRAARAREGQSISPSPLQRGPPVAVERNQQLPFGQAASKSGTTRKGVPRRP